MREVLWFNRTSRVEESEYSVVGGVQVTTCGDGVGVCEVWGWSVWGWSGSVRCGGGVGVCEVWGWSVCVRCG